MNTTNGQSAAKYLSELVSSYDKSSQTSEHSRRLLKLISETGDIKLYSFEERIKSTSISGIYLLITEDKPRIYIGSAQSVSKRIRTHRTALRGGYHHSKHLQRVYNKCKLFYCLLNETSELESQELYYIRLLNAVSSINKTEDTKRNFYNETLIQKNIERTARRVYVYDMVGNYLKSYVSVSDCARSLFGDAGRNSQISRICLNKGLSYRSYRFSYDYKEQLEPYKIMYNTINANKACSKPYKCLTNGKIYKSKSAACRDLNIPGSSCIINNKYKEYEFIKI